MPSLLSFGRFRPTNGNITIDTNETSGPSGLGWTPTTSAASLPTPTTPTTNGGLELSSLRSLGRSLPLSGGLLQDRSQTIQGAPQDFGNGQLSSQETTSRLSASNMTAGFLGGDYDPNVFQTVNDFYNANNDILIPRSRNIADPGLEPKEIDEQLNDAPDSLKILLKGLSAIGQLHPVVGAAVGAFALVMTMDMTRRDNDKKILAVNVQMQELMAVFFEYLDTQKERDCQRFIEEHGGIKAVIDSDDLLEELVAKSGESMTSSWSGSGGSRGLGGAGPGGGKGKGKGGGGGESRGASSRGGGDARKNNELPELRKRLRKELAEDIDEALERNRIMFEKKLDMQSKQLKEALQEESEHIISTLLAGAHDRIIDFDLQTIWKDMGWKGSVKARHFVLALHDYYTDRLNSTNHSTSESHSDGTPTTPLPPASPHPNTQRNSGGSGSNRKSSAPKKKVDDRWALAYINAAYVQPILEAVDDDGTGFVSVKEVNTFVASRPEGWSLPHWIAYWAVGWQATISRYKSKIYLLIRTIFLHLKHILPSNRRAVDEYLFHASFWRIELLLRSTRSVNPNVLSDTDLMRITDAYEKEEEERLDENLQGVEYELDTPATVSLVTGAGRIERYCLTLIYLLLRRHLKVILIACKHVVDTEEFVALNDSLVSVLMAVDYRVQNLEAVFKQTHLDVQARLGNFAFGMFQLSYGDIRRIPIQNTFGMWTPEDDPTAPPNTSSTASNPPPSPLPSVNSPRSATSPASATIHSSAAQSSLPRNSASASLSKGHQSPNQPQPLLYTIDTILTGSEYPLSTIQAIVSQSIPHSTLKYGIKDGFHTTDYYEFEPHRLEKEGCKEVPIQGTWTGHCKRPSAPLPKSKSEREDGEGEEAENEDEEEENGDDDDDDEGAVVESESSAASFSTYVVRLSMKVLKDGRTLVGKGEDYADTFEFKGFIKRRMWPHAGGYEFGFIIEDDAPGGERKGSTSGGSGPKARACYGILDPDKDVITARWVVPTRKRVNPTNLIPPSSVFSQLLSDPDAPTLFQLRRTPPSLVRYRYTQYQFAEDPVRSRWSFAASSALHIAQSQLWSRRFFEARFKERKRFVELTVRSLIVSMRLTPQTPLSLVESGELEYLRQELDPSEARFYQALAEFEIQKLPWHPAWGCDSCGRRITKSRLLCVTCMSEDLSDNIDLCLICIDKSPTKRGFSHDPSHIMVKTEQTLHDFDFARIVETAKGMSDRIKGAFRSIESAMPPPLVVPGVPGIQGLPGIGLRVAGSPMIPGLPMTMGGEDHKSQPVCACCEKRAIPPCWVCLICNKDTYICFDCDYNRRPANSASGHLFSHALVRIRDTSTEGETSLDDRLHSLEHRILTLEYKLTESQALMSSHLSTSLGSIESRVSTMESKVERALAGIEGKVSRALEEVDTKVERRLKEMEERSERRFERIEEVLRMIATQTAALPAVYGQVVRDYARSHAVRKKELP
ncbi:hypothetical protein BDN72DRAFT_846149 [Pluteus cervinus]|uniref:Uncharacterized protein n=1 Tax=Pluteus cervinus TaxID=181527 RepID=A0ACD3AH08_9AGAR|nr:hypothetical protein BDN72DRAFT_846149 [Pluteus cervinus]